MSTQSNDGGVGGDCDIGAKPLEVEEEKTVDVAGQGDKEVIPMLRAECRDATVNIINQVGPDAFLALSSAGRAMREFCFNTPGIKIDWRRGSVIVKKTEEGGFEFDFISEKKAMAEGPVGGKTVSFGQDRMWRGFNLAKPKNGPTGDFLDDFFAGMSFAHLDLADLRKMPFRIHLYYLVLDRIDIDAEALRVIENYLKSIPVKSIRKLACAKVGCWPELIQLISKYKLEVVHAIYPGQEMSDDCLKAISTLNLTSFAYNGDVPLDLISTAFSFPYFWLPRLIPMEMAMAIFERALVIDHLEEWAFYLDVDKDGFGSCFSRYDIMDFDHSEALPDRRPLVFLKIEDFVDEYYMSFYIVRGDGKMLIITRGWGFDSPEVTVEMRFSFGSGPPALASLTASR